MTLLNEELTRFVQEDTIEPMEAYLKAVDKGTLLKLFEGANIKFDAPDE